MKNEWILESVRKLHQEFVELREDSFTSAGVITSLVLGGRYTGYLEMLKNQPIRDSGLTELMLSIDSMVNDPLGVFGLLLGVENAKGADAPRKKSPDEILCHAYIASALKLLANNLNSMRVARRKLQGKAAQKKDSGAT